MLTLFKDRKLVHMLSSNCNPSVTATGKPGVVMDFNKNMGGVDLNDQLCTYYKAGRPSHKWWRYIMWFLVNVSITNAWILFKESGRAASYTHVKFSMELAELLRNNFSSRKNRVIQTPPELALATFHGHKLVRIEGRARICKVCSKNGVRTARGYKKESSYECDVCEIRLCRGACLINWHNQNEVNEQ